MKKLKSTLNPDAEPCQDCKRHSNSPSYCNFHQKYVTRKETCGDFKRAK